MKKTLFFMATLAACLSVPTVFMSCSSDSSDGQEEIIIPDVSTASRIEISYSGDYSNLYPTVYFNAFDMKGNPMSMHTSDGTDVQGYWGKSYEDGEYSSASAQVIGNYTSFAASVSLMLPSGEGSTATVFGKAYRNDKVVKSDSITIALSATEPFATYYFTEKEGFTRQDKD